MSFADLTALFASLRREFIALEKLRARLRARRAI